MSWAEYHKESEELAVRAHVARNAGQLELARVLFSRAADRELRAAAEISPADKPRTYSITAVSSVALLYKADELLQAERTAHTFLAVEGLQTFAAEQLRELLQVVWNERAQAEAGVQFSQSQVTVSVDGGQVVRGGAPLDLVVERVQTVQALFYRTAEYLKKLPLRRKGPATRPIQDVCRPWLFQGVPGSYQFTVAIQGTSQADFFDGENVSPDLLARTFMTILEGAVTSPSERLIEEVPDPEYRKVFLKLARNLAPTGKTFTHMEVKSTRVGLPVVLTQDARRSISQVIRDTEPAPALAEEPVTLRGVLRAVHLDQDWLDLSIDGAPVRVAGVGEALDDVVGPFVNHPVIVRATKDSKGSLRFRDIEPDEDA